MNRYFSVFGLRGSLVLTLLMSGFALAAALISPTLPRLLCLAAMLFSSVGDIFLMHSPAIERRFPNFFTLGACAFMAAHLFYAACYGVKLHMAGGSLLNPGAFAALVMEAALMAGMAYLCAANGRQQRLPLVMSYSMIISLNCLVVFSYVYAQAAVRPWAALSAVGAVSFLLSDLAIGLREAAGITRFEFLIWWLYPIGQILLIACAG